MSHRPITNACHGNESFINATGASLPTIKPAVPPTRLLPQDSGNIFAGTYNLCMSAHELDHQYRQRWKIE